MDILAYIIWSPVPEIFPNLDWGILGNIRWYGLLFAIAFIIGQQIMAYIFKQEDKPSKDIETLTIYIVVGTIIGARLGHVFFYEPLRFLANPIEIFMIQKGGLASHGAAIGIITSIWVYSNYYIRIGFSKPYLIFKKKKRNAQGFLWVIDRIVIVVALGGCFIRMGNFLNSEIIGKPYNGNMAVFFARDLIDLFERDKNIDELAIEKSKKSDNVVIEKSNTTTSDYLNPVLITIRFKNNDYKENQIRAYMEGNIKGILTNYEYIRMHINEPKDKPLEYTLKTDPDGSFTAVISTFAIPRHATQVYEALTSLLLAFVLFWIWTLKKSGTQHGRLFGLFLIVLFGLRFFHELFKENQVDFENTIPLNMGQWLSIPLILIGLYVFFRSFKAGSSEHTQ
jgi:prolipoprotein diacylglyceryl transferase